tara:strand:+ start:23 stop:280 length:258 start_codon:yes stop_codon:yes gene_type:complete
VKKIVKILFSIGIALILVISHETACAKEPKSKFYDFNEQLIDGERKKPTTLFTDARQKVKFDRLLKLKKSFLPKLFKTARERVFK